MYQSALNFSKPARHRGAPVDRPEKDAFAGQLFADGELVRLEKLHYNREKVQGADGRALQTTMSWTFVRMLPTLDEDDPTRWAPGFLDGGPDTPTTDGRLRQPGQWFRGFRVFTGGVTRRTSFITWDAADSEDVRWENPAFLLAHNVRKAVEKGHHELANYTYNQKELDKQAQELRGRYGAQAPPPAAAGDDDDEVFNKYSAPLAYPQTKYFVRALVMQRGGQPLQQVYGLAPEDKVTCLVLSQSTGPALLRDLNKYGYNLGIHGGAFHCFFPEGDSPWEADAYRKSKPAPSYEVLPFPTSMQGFALPSPDLSAYEPLLRQKLVPFGEVFRIPDLESQAEILATAVPFEVLAIGWRGDRCRDFLKIAEKVHKRTATVEMSVPQPAPAAYAAPTVTYAPPVPMHQATMVPAMPAPGGFAPPPPPSGPAPLPGGFAPPAAMPGAMPAPGGFAPPPPPPSPAPMAGNGYMAPPPTMPAPAAPAVPAAPGVMPVVQQHMPPRAQPGAGEPLPGSAAKQAEVDRIMAEMLQQAIAAGK